MSGHLYDVDKCRTLLKSQVTILTLVAVGLLVLFVSVVVLSIVEIKNGKRKTTKRKTEKRKKGKQKNYRMFRMSRSRLRWLFFVFYPFAWEIK